MSNPKQGVLLRQSWIMLSGSTFHSSSTLSLTLSTRIYPSTCDTMASIVRSLHYVMATFWSSGMWLCIECDQTLPCRVHVSRWDQRWEGGEESETWAEGEAKVVEAEKVQLRKRRRTDGMCEDNHPCSPYWATYLKHKWNKDGNELSPAMDNMINTGCPGCRFRCMCDNDVRTNNTSKNRSAHGAIAEGGWLFTFVKRQPSWRGTKK